MGQDDPAAVPPGRHGPPARRTPRAPPRQIAGTVSRRIRPHKHSLVGPVAGTCARCPAVPEIPAYRPTADRHRFWPAGDPRSPRNSLTSTGRWRPTDASTAPRRTGPFSQRSGPPGRASRCRGTATGWPSRGRASSSLRRKRPDVSGVLPSRGDDRDTGMLPAAAGYHPWQLAPLRRWEDASRMWGGGSPLHGQSTHCLCRSGVDLVSTTPRAADHASAGGSAARLP